MEIEADRSSMEKPPRMDMRLAVAARSVMVKAALLKGRPSMEPEPVPVCVNPIVQAPLVTTVTVAQTVWAVPTSLVSCSGARRMANNGGGFVGPWQTQV